MLPPAAAAAAAQGLLHLPAWCVFARDRRPAAAGQRTAAARAVVGPLQWLAAKHGVHCFHHVNAKRSAAVMMPGCMRPLNLSWGRDLAGALRLRSPLTHPKLFKAPNVPASLCLWAENQTKCEETGGASSVAACTAMSSHASAAASFGCASSRLSVSSTQFGRARDGADTQEYWSGLCEG
jgi:hypothetical protein